MPTHSIQSKGRLGLSLWGHYGLLPGDDFGRRMGVGETSGDSHRDGEILEDGGN